MLNLTKEIDPAYYKEFIYIYIHKKCMYAETKNAVYGTLEVLLLFCTKLSKPPK